MHLRASTRSPSISLILIHENGELASRVNTMENVQIAQNSFTIFPIITNACTIIIYIVYSFHACGDLSMDMLWHSSLASCSCLEVWTREKASMGLIFVIWSLKIDRGSCFGSPRNFKAPHVWWLVMLYNIKESNPSSPILIPLDCWGSNGVMCEVHTRQR